MQDHEVCAAVFELDGAGARGRIAALYGALGRTPEPMTAWSSFKAALVSSATAAGGGGGEPLALSEGGSKASSDC